MTFCWHWWNCWSLLFKLYFHNIKNVHIVLYYAFVILRSNIKNVHIVLYYAFVVLSSNIKNVHIVLYYAFVVLSSNEFLINEPMFPTVVDGLKIKKKSFLSKLLYLIEKASNINAIKCFSSSIVLHNGQSLFSLIILNITLFIFRDYVLTLILDFVINLLFTKFYCHGW